MTFTLADMKSYTVQARDLARAGDINAIIKLAEEVRSKGASPQFASNIERYTEAAIMSRQRQDR